MTMLKQKIQGGKTFEHHVFKCYCGEHSYLEIIKDLEDQQYYISVTQHPTKLMERLKFAWKSLRGLEFTNAGEVIIDGDDIDKLISALAKSKAVGKK